MLTELDILKDVTNKFDQLNLGNKYQVLKDE